MERKTERENLIELSLNNLLMLNEAYRKGEPKVSDEEFDELEVQFKKLDPTNPYFNKGINDEKGMIKLPIKMTSLDKLKSLEEIKKWLLKHNLPLNTKLICLPKLDGCAILIEDENKNAFTRGDGERGGQIREHFSYVPYSSNGKNGFVIGEALISKKKFKEKYSKEILGEEGYSNPRNMVASLFNPHSTPQKDKLNDVTFIPHSLSLKLSQTHELGKQFQVNICNEISNYPLYYTVTSIEEGLNEGQINAMFESWSRDFEIDGIVIEIVNADIRKSLGYEKNGNPVFAKAYKKNWEEVKETIVRKIQLQVGKTGKVTPVAIFDPIILEGAECTNVTLYNVRDMMKKNITIGSRIKVCRSGGVIAKVVEVLNPEIPGLQYEMLIKEFGHNWGWDDNAVDIYLKEPNDEQKIKQLVHFFETIGVEDLGEPTIKSFYENGFKTVDKIISSIINDDLISIKGIGHKTIFNLKSQFTQLIPNLSFAKLADASCCFEGLGERTLELIEFQGPRSFSDTLFLREKLEAIEGVGPISANSFINNLSTFIEFCQINKLPIPKFRQKEQLGNKFENQIICFTGFRNDELKKQIELEGGKVTDSVSGNTTLLLVKEISTKISSKEQKAQQLGIKIQSIQEFQNGLN